MLVMSCQLPNCPCFLTHHWQIRQKLSSLSLSPNIFMTCCKRYSSSSGLPVVSAFVCFPSEVSLSDERAVVASSAGGTMQHFLKPFTFVLTFTFFHTAITQLQTSTYVARR